MVARLAKRIEANKVAAKAAVTAREVKPKRGMRPTKKILHLIQVAGYDKEDAKVDMIEVLPGKYGSNSDFTPRQAKRSLAARGAVTFIRTNVYKDAPHAS